MRRSVSGAIAIVWAAGVLFSAGGLVAAEGERPPNFVLIVCDNLGYGDIGPFGAEANDTPHLDRMAEEGRKFTHFYATSGVCTPSRASILTGCYPRRVSMARTDGAVLRPVSRIGLHPDEITVAEVLKDRGYATAAIGKWHLGDQPKFLPTRQGFDFYFGVPYSDDMTQRPNKPWPPLPLMKNERVIEAPVDRNLLTKRYTEQAIAFMEDHRDEPFFLYLPHAMPGSTRHPFASERFRGESGNGPWGDAVAELDWSTGQILDALERLGLARRTLVIFTSDNGAPRRQPPQGRNEPLAGWGYTTAEGGQRVPTIAWWPGKVPADTVCSELTTTMDLMPTLARLAGTKPPQDRILDGHDIRPLLFGRSDASSPYVAFYYYQVDQLQAVRSGPWKLYLPVKPQRGWRKKPRPDEPLLYNVRKDPGETRNVAAKHRDLVEQMKGLAAWAREDLGDGEKKGEHQRPHGTVEEPTARLKKGGDDG